MRKVEWLIAREDIKQSVRDLYIVMVARGDRETYYVSWAAKRIAFCLSQATGYKQYKLKRIAYEVLLAEGDQLEDQAFEGCF